MDRDRSNDGSDDGSEADPTMYEMYASSDWGDEENLD